TKSVANNGNPAATTNANYSIAPYITPMRITTQPTDQVASVGGAVTFRITAVGSFTTPESGANGPANWRYEWKHGATVVGHGASITLTNVQASDAGSYTCDVSNIDGTVTSNAVNLTVY